MCNRAVRIPYFANDVYSDITDIIKARNGFQKISNAERNLHSMEIK